MGLRSTSITGFSLLHISVGTIALIIVAIRYQGGRYNADDIEIVNLFWQFVGSGLAVYRSSRLSDEPGTLEPKVTRSEIMATAEGHGMGKYVAVYVCLLVLTALQFLIGYQNSQGSQMAVRMLTFAIIETVLVVLFFMNLGSEKPVFVKFIVYFMLFVLATMNYIWTDSFRLLLFRLTNFGPS